MACGAVRILRLEAMILGLVSSLVEFDGARRGVLVEEKGSASVNVWRIKRAKNNLLSVRMSLEGCRGGRLLGRLGSLPVVKLEEGEPGRDDKDL